MLDAIFRFLVAARVYRLGPGLAAPLSGPVPQGRGSPAPEAAQEGRAGRCGAGFPGRGAEGPPHCTDAETEARRGPGCHDRQPGTGTPASVVFRSRGPQTSPASNTPGTGKPGYGSPTFQPAPRAAPGRLPAGLGLGGGADASGVRVTAAGGGLGLTSRRRWQWL